jgi:hypothetical protein
MPQDVIQYRSIADIDIYDSPDLVRLATQMEKGRYLRILIEQQVQLLEDDYTGFLRVQDLAKLQFAGLVCYCPILLTELQIRSRLTDVIAYTQTAMQQKNEYLWGGTLPPNYDCSGLMQAAFAAFGIWIPRDAYQQEAFTTPMRLEEIEPGDLIFFGTELKANHVGMYLGEGRYIHSSGKDKGRNGIAIDRIVGGDRISDQYATQIRGAGRVTRCYSQFRTLG